MAVSKRTRFEVLKRDNHTCRYCYATDQPLTVDHVLPVALGGSDKPENLVAACRDCNAGKSSTNPDAPLVADVAADALRWKAALDQSMRDAEGAIASREQYRETFIREWKKTDRRCLMLDPSWFSTLSTWHDTGVPIALVVEASKIACSTTKVSNQDVWRYMCGIVWRRLEDIRDAVATPATPARCGHCWSCTHDDPSDMGDCTTLTLPGEDEDGTWCETCESWTCMWAHGADEGGIRGWMAGTEHAERKYRTRDLGTRDLEYVIDGGGR